MLLVLLHEIIDGCFLKKVILKARFQSSRLQGRREWERAKQCKSLEALPVECLNHGEKLGAAGLPLESISGIIFQECLDMIIQEVWQSHPFFSPSKLHHCYKIVSISCFYRATPLCSIASTCMKLLVLFLKVTPHSLKARVDDTFIRPLKRSHE